MLHNGGIETRDVYEGAEDWNARFVWSLYEYNMFLVQICREISGKSLQISHSYLK
jgi:hypothetical protein